MIAYAYDIALIGRTSATGLRCLSMPPAIATLRRCNLSGAIRSGTRGKEHR